MYSTIDNISESLKLSWKHKILWVAALLMLSGGRYSSGSPTQSNKNTGYTNDTEYQQMFESEYNVDLNEIQQDPSKIYEMYNMEPPVKQGIEKGVLGAVAQQIQPVLPENGAPVLGRPDPLTQGKYDFLTPYLSKLASIILGIVPAIIIVVVFAIIVGIVIRSWALSAMIGGTYEGDKQDGVVDLKLMGRYGKDNLSSMVKLNLYVFLNIFVITVLFVLLVAVTAISVPILGLVISLPLAVVFGLYLIRLGLFLPFSARHIVLKQMPYKLAYKAGIKTMYDNFSKVLKLAFGNCFVTAIIMFLVIMVAGVGGAIIAAGASGFDLTSDAAPFMVFIFGIVSMPFLLAFALVIQAASGFTGTFANFAWTRLYKHIDEGNAPVLKSSPLVRDPELAERDEIMQSRLPPKPKPKEEQKFEAEQEVNQNEQ